MWRILIMDKNLGFREYSVFIDGQMAATTTTSGTWSADGFFPEGQIVRKTVGELRDEQERMYQQKKAYISAIGFDPFLKEKDMFQRDPTKVLQLSFEREGIFNPIVKPVKLDKDNLINVPIMYGPMGNRYLLSGFVKLNTPKVVTAEKLEKTILYLLLRTKYNESLTPSYGRYLFDFNGCSTFFLKHLINTLLECDLKRINLSWVGPLQNLLIARKLDKLNDSKKKDKKKKRTAEEQWHVETAKPRGSTYAAVPDSRKTLKSQINSYFNNYDGIEFRKRTGVTKKEYLKMSDGYRPDPMAHDNYSEASKLFLAMLREGSILERKSTPTGPVIVGTPEPQIQRINPQPPEYFQAVAKQQEDEWLSPKETEIKRPSTSTRLRKESGTLSTEVRLELVRKKKGVVLKNPDSPTKAKLVHQLNIMEVEILQEREMERIRENQMQANQMLEAQLRDQEMQRQQEVQEAEQDRTLLHSYQ